MTDQATILRGLMQRRTGAHAEAATPGKSSAHIIAVTSGKGGVGKTNIALNLAIALSQMDASVALLDANLGLGNIDLLSGLNGYWNLSHVIAGARELKDIVLEGPNGIRVIPGASGLADVADCPESAQADVLRQMQSLEEASDFVIIDTGTGIHRTVRQFASAADTVLIVTTPEPTSIADAYATIKSLSACDETLLEVIVNQAHSVEQAREILRRLQRTSRIFLKCETCAAGIIPFDRNVGIAVARRKPFLLDAPQCPASQQIKRLARRLMGVKLGQPSRGYFFTRLWHRLLRRAA